MTLDLWYGRAIERAYHGDDPSERDPRGRFASLGGGARMVVDLLKTMSDIGSAERFAVDDDNSFDWSDRGEGGTFKWEVYSSDVYGGSEETFPELTLAQMDELHTRLTDALRDPEDAETGFYGHEVGSDVEWYFDWSTIQNDQYVFEVHDGDEDTSAAQVWMTRDELRQLHAALTWTLISEATKGNLE